MHSMTGYGSGRSNNSSNAGAAGGLQCAVEISSVNRRQSELLVNLPRELLALEPRVRETVQARVARGRLNVNITCQRAAALPAATAAGAAAAGESATSAPPAFLLDVAAARAFHRAALELQSELGLTGGIDLETVLRAPGVVRTPQSAAQAAGVAAGHSTSSKDPAETLSALTPETVWPLLEPALGQALEALVAMREREGQHLAADLRARTKTLRQLVGEIRVRAPRAVENQRRALRDRLAHSGVEFAPDDDRLVRELAIFADRCDIAEELTRLEGHLEQLEALLDQPGPVGRTLDFLGQEIARELNTLGVKAGDLEISRLVIAGKAELEKIREQVQNIE